MVTLLIIYVIAVNLLGLLSMRSDKTRAKRSKYRIPERRLFLIAAAGGAIGVYAGMQMFRHKTKHPSFFIGIPLILFVQLVLIGYVWAKAALA